MKHVTYESDRGWDDRAKLGLIVLQTDETIEPEFRDLVDSERACLYHSRVPSGTDVTPETLAAMGAALPEAARLLPPTIAFDAIGYACTSGATIIGEAAVARAVNAFHPGAAVTNPLTALKAALAALDIRRLAVLAPYVPEVTEALGQALQDNGIAISSLGTFNEREERAVVRIAPASLIEGARAMGQDPKADAVFISCTNLRTAGIIDQAEAAIGKPVLTSNQVLAWHMSRLAGLDEGVAGPGRLFRARPVPLDAA